MRSEDSRRLALFGLVIALTVGTGLGARRNYRAPTHDAPSYRQKGPAAAKILIVEFSDFQCPACRSAEPFLTAILSMYGDRIRFIFKHFPLKQHEWARTAAIAAECAGRQGKFWAFHDSLYLNQETWTNDGIENYLGTYAKESGLDAAAWKTCRADPAVSAAIDADTAEGKASWVMSTPTFFINGRRFVGGIQLQSLGAAYIDRMLKQ